MFTKLWSFQYSCMHPNVDHGFQWHESHWILPHEMSAKDPRNQLARFRPEHWSLVHGSTICVRPDYEGMECHIQSCGELRDSTPAHQACYAKSSFQSAWLGWPPDPTWKCQPSHLCTKWTDQLSSTFSGVDKGGPAPPPPMAGQKKIFFG